MDARVTELEKALADMVLLVQKVIIDSEGRYPNVDAGCIDCTHGTVPNRRNTGPCTYHKAKRLLGQL